MLGSFGEGLIRVKVSQSARYDVSTHQVPSLALILEFFLTHNSKDTFWSTGRRVNFEVQRKDIGRAIAEVVETIKELIDDLERVVTRSEGEYCV